MCMQGVNMKLLLSLLVLIACVAAVCADYCDHDGFSYTWYCSFSCCYDYAFCCNNYWYAWTAASVFLFCLCSAAGFGGYRYRRYHVVRTYAPLNAGNTTTVVTSANTNTYQPQPAPYYQSNAPPAYK